MFIIDVSLGQVLYVRARELAHSSFSQRAHGGERGLFQSQKMEPAVMKGHVEGEAAHSAWGVGNRKAP